MPVDLAATPAAAQRARVVVEAAAAMQDRRCAARGDGDGVLGAQATFLARGQGFTYDLTELGRHCRDYVELMAHYDAMLPGRVHRVRHERLVADPAGEIGRLLDHCRLALEDQSLAFHTTARSVRTASSEQVRRPLSAEGINQWRHCAPWLGPLADALGDLPGG